MDCSDDLWRFVTTFFYNFCDDLCRLGPTKRSDGFPWQVTGPWQSIWSLPSFCDDIRDNHRKNLVLSVTVATLLRHGDDQTSLQWRRLYIVVIVTTLFLSLTTFFLFVATSCFTWRPFWFLWRHLSFRDNLLISVTTTSFLWRFYFVIVKTGRHVN